MSDEVTLRDPDDADEPVIFEQQNDPEAGRTAAFRIRDRQAHLDHWRRIRASDDNRLQTILWNGHIAGNIGSFTLGGRRLVGYWIGREFRGRGIASRALALFLGYDRTRPLDALVAKHNAASIRVLEKNGFVRVGEDVIPAGSADGDAPVEEWVMRLEESRRGP